MNIRRMLVRTLKDNKWFFLPYLVLLLLVLPVIIITDKGNLHLWLNRYHNHFFDWTFKQITWIGDGVFIGAVCFIFIFFSFRNTLFLLSSFLVTGIVAQLLKRMAFADVTRPVQYFKDVAELHLVEGIKLLGYRSFPSGHATSAFVLFLCLALMVKNKWVKLLFLILAMLVSFSRVYLSQHFLMDIVAGSLIGILGALAMYMVLFRSEKAWHKRNLTSLFVNK